MDVSETSRTFEVTGLEAASAYSIAGCLEGRFDDFDKKVLEKSGAPICMCITLTAANSVIIALEVSKLERLSQPILESDETAINITRRNHETGHSADPSTPFYGIISRLGVSHDSNSPR